MLNERALQGDRESVTTACRRLGDTLGLDAVGVLRGLGDRRRLTWWASPGGTARPLDVDAILDGSAEDWLVAHHDGGALFARLTPETSIHASEVLRAVAGVLVEAVDELDEPMALPEALPTLARVAPHEEPAVPSPASNGRPSTTAASVAGTLEALLQRDRARLAYEVHDGLTQSVTAAVLTLEMLGERIRRDPDGAAEALGETTVEIRACLDRLRGTLDGLAGGAPASQTPDESLTTYADEAARRWGLSVRVEVDGELPRLPAPTAEAAHVVVAEGLANAAKHGGGEGVGVTFRGSPEGIEIEVEDLGSGFSPDDVREGGHYGLAMMRARVEDVGGELDVRSAPGRGTRVVARLPVTSGGETP